VTVIYHLTIQLLNTLVIGWLGLCFLLAVTALGLAARFTTTTLTEAEAEVVNHIPSSYEVYNNLAAIPVPILAITSAAITILTLPIL
jgi:hypothetical protein